jgi:four helix bundle protein
MKNSGSGPVALGGKQPPRDTVQRTFEFADRIVQLCVVPDERPGVARVMMSQTLRAGTSVPANVEESQAAQSKADFVSKMSIALKEARETHLRLRLVAGAAILPKERLQLLIDEAEEVKRVIGAIIISTKRRINGWFFNFAFVIFN